MRYTKQTTETMRREDDHRNSAGNLTRRTKQKQTAKVEVLQREKGS